ncbi:hypothetical protein ACX1DX_09270 [Tessaracoccus sp. Y36]
MTETTTTREADVASRDLAHTGTAAARTDPLLLALVRTFNSADADCALSITLSVQGEIITGTLIGVRQWATLAAQQLRQSNVAGGGLELVAAAIERTFAPTEEDPERAAPGDEIHLMDAAYFGSGSPLPPEGNLLWRGKLASVDGWHWGTYLG